MPPASTCWCCCSPARAPRRPPTPCATAACGACSAAPSRRAGSRGPGCAGLPSLAQQLGGVLGHHVVDEHAGAGLAARQVLELAGGAPDGEHLEAEVGQIAVG